MLPFGEQSSISICIERPCGDDSGDDADDGEIIPVAALSLELLASPNPFLPLPRGGLAAETGVAGTPAAASLSNIIRRIETVDGGLVNSNEGTCFIFSEPRDEVMSISSCAA